MKNTENIIAGLFLVILGFLFLLRNFNILDFNIGDIFKLWPIALIYVGVEMLPVDSKTKIYLQTIVIVLFFIALISLPSFQDYDLGSISNTHLELLI
jgi:hypothetical protein